MIFFVGITDKDWFDYLANLKPDEVNFWRPGGTQSFKAIDQGAPFLFKLHSPLNYIVGGGFFVSHTTLPLSLAWEVFEKKNGTPDILTLWESISKHRRNTERDPVIGCTVLTDPFFFEESDWIEIPSDWSFNIVVGKRYDSSDPIGGDLWHQVALRLPRYQRAEEEDKDDMLVRERGERYGSEHLVRARLGQGGFRVLVTDAYQRRCAISQERTLPVLQASHIKPYAESGPHRISNGLLLRSDLHILFDRGYLSVTPDYHVEVSKRIKEEFENGRDYYAFHGTSLNTLPRNEQDRPSREYLEWHYGHIFEQ